MHRFDRAQGRHGGLEVVGRGEKFDKREFVGVNVMQRPGETCWRLMSGPVGRLPIGIVPSSCRCSTQLSARQNSLVSISRT